MRDSPDNESSAIRLAPALYSMLPDCIRPDVVLDRRQDGLSESREVNFRIACVVKGAQKGQQKLTTVGIKCPLQNRLKVKKANQEL